MASTAVQEIISARYTEKGSEYIERCNPDYIGTVAGVRFHEHPTFGDEAPLIAKIDGRWVKTCFYELPTFCPKYGEFNS